MVSIVDVANRAGVSATTVSRVLSGSTHPISGETRERVLEAARSLNYFPNALAQAMVTRATRIVGVIIGDAVDPYFAAIVRGVEDVARQHGYLVIVCNSDRVPHIELSYLQTLSNYRVDGIIFAGGGLTDEDYIRQAEQTLADLFARGSVCVSLGQHLFSSLSVRVDNERLTYDAVNYLISLGHRRIAYVSGPAGLTTPPLRLNGYRAALAEAGLAVEPELILPGDFTAASGLAAAEVLAALPVRPTAVLVSNDLMAIGCLAGLKEHGQAIPAAISVMGIDDIAMARFVDPPLTTMALPLYDLGALGMEHLIRLRAGEINLGHVIILPHRLIIRESTAPPGEPATKRDTE